MNSARKNRIHGWRVGAANVLWAALLGAALATAPGCARSPTPDRPQRPAGAASTRAVVLVYEAPTIVVAARRAPSGAPAPAATTTLFWEAPTITTSATRETAPHPGLYREASVMAVATPRPSLRVSARVP